MSSLWGAIFDFDGVIVDSSAHHERSWELLAEAEGLPLPPDHFKRGFGMRNVQIIPDLLGWTRDPEEIERLSRRKQSFYIDLIRSEGTRPLPGVPEFLASLTNAGVAAAVGSSAPKRNLQVVLEVTGLAPHFVGIVAAECVHHGKPHPEVFLKCAERLGLPPARCIVFEDAHVGIQAGQAAGCKVVAVATTHPREELSAAERVVQRLDELQPQELGRWLES